MFVGYLSYLTDSHVNGIYQPVGWATPWTIHAYNFKQPGYTEGGLLHETKKKRPPISISIYLKVYSMVL